MVKDSATDAIQRRRSIGAKSKWREALMSTGGQTAWWFQRFAAHARRVGVTIGAQRTNMIARNSCGTPRSSIGSCAAIWTKSNSYSPKMAASAPLEYCNGASAERIAARLITQILAGDAR